MNKKLLIITYFFNIGLQAAFELDVPKANPKEDYNFELVNKSGAPINIVIRSVPPDLNFNFPVPAHVQALPDASEVKVPEDIQKEGEEAVKNYLEKAVKALRLERINRYLDQKKMEEVKRKVRFYITGLQVNSVLRLGGKSRLNTKEDIALIIYPGPKDMYGNPTLMPFIFTDLKPGATIFVEWNGKDLVPQKPTFFSGVFSKDKRTASGLPLSNNIIQQQNIIKGFFSTPSYRPRGDSGFRTIFSDLKIVPDYKNLGPIELIQKFENR
ncbi:MAG: hypothetical protein ACOYT8_05575 [Candidatus Dependentiae bacterium]